MQAAAKQNYFYSQNLNYAILSVENELLYVNVTVDLLFDDRVKPTNNLWKSKKRRSTRVRNNSKVASIYKYPDYRLNEDPAIIMKHRSNMFDITELSETKISKTTSSIMRMMSYANKLASDSWKSISDAIFSQEQHEIENFLI